MLDALVLPAIPYSRAASFIAHLLELAAALEKANQPRDQYHHDCQNYQPFD